MNETISRRKMLSMTAGAAAGASWVFALDGKGGGVRAASASGDFVPSVFSGEQLESVAVLCETIIPRTDTPGARDARVHEYIDVRLSGRYPDVQRRFLRGLNWLEGRCSAEFNKPIAQLSESECAELLNPISDRDDEHADNLKPGAEFFDELKRLTIHGYYTSREGRVETLGLPEHIGMEQWVGCTHSGDDHT